MKKLIVAIPAYNEGKNIKNVIMAIPREFSGISSVLILVIDDGSVDDTSAIAKDLGVVVMRHEKNYGLGKTFRDAVQKSLEYGADYMVNIDGDGQFDPRDIHKLLIPVIEGRADFVSASRFCRKGSYPQMSRMKIMGNIFLAKVISSLIRKDVKDVSCGFRAYNREALLRINLFGNFTYTQETFLDLGMKGLRICEVETSVRYFSDRKSSISGNLIRYAWRTFKIIFRATRDYRPLKIFGGMGIGFFLFGTIFNIFLLLCFVKTGSFTPYKFLGFFGAFFNILGIIIFFLGLIADMLYRMRMIGEETLYILKKKHYEDIQKDAL